MNNLKRSESNDFEIMRARTLSTLRGATPPEIERSVLALEDFTTWDSSDYEARVRKLEAEGMTRSDAQAVADANTMNPTADCGHFKGCECWKTY